MKQKKIISLVLALVMALSFCVTSAFASGKSCNLSGYKTYKNYDCTTYMQGTMTSLWNSVKFTGKSGGQYKGTTKATKIKHMDHIKSTGIGSVSVGCDSSGPSASASISGNTWTESYTANNTKSITVYPTYIGSAALLTFRVYFSASTQYQFGSTYVTVHTGDASILHD